MERTTNRKIFDRGFPENTLLKNVMPATGEPTCMNDVCLKKQSNFGN